MATIWLPTGAIGVDTFAWSWNPGFEVGLPVTVALTAVALIGYLFGQRTGHADQAQRNAERHQELQRASSIAHQLESIANMLRQDLANHHGRLAQFRRRLGDANASHDEQAWKELCGEAEKLVSPTMQLAEHLSSAYDAIRQQTGVLELFSQARTDPQTGVGNGRALEDKLGVLLSAAHRGGSGFSVALVSIDHDASDDADGRRPSPTRQVLELARLIRSCIRDNDFVARYGDDDFVIVMPQTNLPGASLFGERLRQIVSQQMALGVSCGVTQYQPKDDAKSLLARADSAFYSAKAAGGNQQFVHTGTQIREYRTTNTPRPSEPELTSTDVPAIPSLDSADLGELAICNADGQ